jgi:hypothetical protein
MFIDRGDASAASNHALQTADATVDILKELIESLLERLRAQQANEEVPDRSPEEEQTLNDRVADAAINVMEQSGSEFHQTESGEWFNVCYTESGLVVRVNLDDPTGMPVYTISTLEQGDILSFQKDPSQEGYVFFETEGEMEDKQKLKFLESLKSQREVDPNQVPLSGIDRVKATVEVLDDLAPAGSRAVLVANEFLEQSGGKPIFGKTYAFSKDADGSISVGMKSEPDKPIFKMHPSGKMEGTADASILSDFKQMHQKLASAAQAPQVAAPAPVKAQPIDQGGR